MKSYHLYLLALALGVALIVVYAPPLLLERGKPAGGIIKLPEPSYHGMTLEEALVKRRSVRNFSSKNLSINQISQILWAAQGITHREKGFRTAPSAGALYPLEIYIATPDGVYHYIPEEHALEKVLSGDVRRELYTAALRQESVLQAPVVLIITAVFERTTSKYGKRGIRYVYMEAGHVAQNVYLECTSLGLGTVAVGAFQDEEVKRILNLPRNYQPLYLMPIGYRRE